MIPFFGTFCGCHMIETMKKDKKEHYYKNKKGFYLFNLGKKDMCN